MSALHPNDRARARAALGLPNPRKIANGGHWTPSASDRGAWDAMVDAGLAVRRPGRMGLDDSYHLTRDALEGALSPGESLGDVQPADPAPEQEARP